MKKWIIGLLVIAGIYSCKNEGKPAEQERTEKHLQLLEDLEKQVRQFPDSTPVRMRLVNVLDSLGRYSEAIIQVDSMIMKDSMNNGLWYAKGQLFESNKDTNAAINSYEKAVSVYPSLESQLSLANLYAEKKDSRSLAICQAVSRTGVDREIQAHCDFIAGIYYARVGQHAKAIELFNSCINNNYTYMEAYMEKGFIHFEQKNFKEALEVFDRAITVNNMYADAYYWKAKTYEVMGNKAEAITNYQRSLGLDKGLKEAREALKRLE